MKELTRKMDGFSRRQFVESMAKTALGVTALPFMGSVASAASPLNTTAFNASAFNAAAKNAKQVIYLFMNGAMSQIDTWDPKPGAEEQGETKAISTSVPGLMISENLPAMAKLMKHVALIRSMTQETAAHEPGSYRMRTSYDPIASTRHPAMGAWLLHSEGRLNPELPGNVLIGGANRHPGAGYLSAQHSPVPVQNAKIGLQNTKPPSYMKETQFKRRMSLSSSFDRSFQTKYKTNDVKSYSQLYREAVKLLKSKDLEAFDISKEPENIRNAYGETTIGQGCLLARRLIEKKVRFVEVAFGGWDDHRDIFSNIPDRLQQLDQALSSLLKDLASKGLFESTLVVLGTEFGRSPAINVNAGRDHHPGAFSVLLAGGGIQRGAVYGQTDERAGSVEEDPVTVQELNATIAKACGIDHEEEIYSPAGRPFTFSNGGQPIEKVLA